MCSHSIHLPISIPLSFSQLSATVWFIGCNGMILGPSTLHWTNQMYMLTDRNTSRIDDINKSCLEQFRAHWQCLDNNNHQLWQCRPAEWKLNKCVFENTVRHPSFHLARLWFLTHSVGSRENRSRPAQEQYSSAPEDRTDLRQQIYQPPREAIHPREGGSSVVRGRNWASELIGMPAAAGAGDSPSGFTGLCCYNLCTYQ